MVKLDFFLLRVGYKTDKEGLFQTLIWPLLQVVMMLFSLNTTEFRGSLCKNSAYKIVSIY
jgi:hypothetical protein